MSKVIVVYKRVSEEAWVVGAVVPKDIAGDEELALNEAMLSKHGRYRGPGQAYTRDAVVTETRKFFFIAQAGGLDV